MVNDKEIIRTEKNFESMYSSLLNPSIICCLCILEENSLLAFNTARIAGNIIKILETTDPINHTKGKDNGGKLLRFSASPPPYV